jgi:hypothetical protein
VPTIPLASSSADPASTWATIALGHFDDPLDTFWQLFALSSGPSRWELATPPGVASNGGLVASVAGGTVLAGFQPSQDLLFSPLAQSTTEGSSWSPGLLPTGLAPVPDSLATNGSGRSVALLRVGNGRVVTNPGDLSTWTTGVAEDTLAATPGGSKCGLRRLTAVAIVGAGTAVGGVCTASGPVGIFLRSGTGAGSSPEWRPVGPALPTTGQPTEVIRLATTPAGTAALVSAGTEGAATLYALWSTDGLKTWTESSGFRLGGATLVSTGLTGTDGWVINASGPGANRAAQVASPGGPWQSLAAPPVGTSAVVATPAGTLEALIGKNSTLTVDTLASGVWTHTQTLGVPIQYGSSG